MLIKALLIAIILYFIFTRVRSLIRAVMQDGAPGRLEQDRSTRWGVPRRPHPRAERDVEDAKFVDI